MELLQNTNWRTTSGANSMLLATEAQNIEPKYPQAKHDTYKPGRSYLAGTASSPSFSATGGAWTDGGDIPTGQQKFIEWATVTISCSTAGAQVYYTTDGSDPTPSSTFYTGPVFLQGVYGWNTLRARAYASGLSPSPIIASPIYDVVAQTQKPIISGVTSVNAKNGQIIVTVTIQAVSGAKVFYTVDGTSPVCQGSIGYTGPFVISTGGTTVVQAKARQYVFTPPIDTQGRRNPAGFEYTCSVAASKSFLVAPMVTAPVIQPASGGTFIEKVGPILISCATVSAWIRFTVDGTDPTSASPMYPAGGLMIGLEDFNQSSFIVKAIASAPSMVDSVIVASGPFVVVPQAPTITVPSGPYIGQVLITMQSSHLDASVFYTIDGTTPTEKSTLYTGPWQLSITGTVVQAIVHIANKVNSAVAAVGPLAIRSAPPSFIPASGPYINTATVYLQSSDPGAIISYSTDGSVPSLQYDPRKGIIVSSTKVIVKATSKSHQLGTSDAVSTQINIKASQPQIQPNGGTFVNQVSVSITSATSGAVIRYTLDGTTPTSASPVYTGLIVLNTSNVVVNALASNPNLDDSDVATSNAFLVKAAAPTISPNSGSFDGSVLVNILTSTVGADIRCTLDGSTPSDQTPVCTNPVVIQNSGTVVTAVATKVGLLCSDATVTASGFVIRTLPVTYTPNGGTFTDQVSVVLSSPTPGALIYYTSDGSTPTASSTLYSGAVTVSQTGLVIQSVALSDGKVASTPSSSAVFTVLASPPSFSASGTPWNVPVTRSGELVFLEGATVTISCATARAQVYYTTDGSDPTSSSTLYTGPVSVQKIGFTTLRARAYASGLSPSPIAASLVYDIFARTTTPILSPAGPGPFVTSVTVAIQVQKGANVYCTLDGSIPVAGVSPLCGAPLVIATFGTTVVSAIASRDGFADSLVASGSYLVLEQVQAPVIQPQDGGPVYTTSALFTITCATSAAQIHYTIDGTTPTAASPVYPDGGLSVSLSAGALAPMVFTLRAVGINAPAMADSPVASAGPFTVQPLVAAPTISPQSGGPFLNSVTVTLACATPGAGILYTTDGTPPLSSPSAIRYSGPFTLSAAYPAGNSVAAAAALPGFTPSAVVSASWTVQLQACQPSIGVPGGSYVVGVSISISCPPPGVVPPGAAIHYTTDGSAPDAAAALIYGGPFALAQPGTYVVHAISVGDHLFPSAPVASDTIQVSPDLSCQANYYADLPRKRSLPNRPPSHLQRLCPIT